MEAGTPEPGYLHYARAGRLQVLRCRATGLPVEYGLSYCSCCDADELILTEAATRGEVTSIVWYHRQYAGDHVPPYNVSVVRLHDGPEVLGTLADIAPGAHPVGQQVNVRLESDGHIGFSIAAK